MTDLLNSGKTRIVELHFDKKDVFYIQEDIARYHSAAIDQQIKDRPPEGGSNLIKVYLDWCKTPSYVSEETSNTQYRDAMILFLDYVHHNGLESNDAGFWNTYPQYLPSDYHMVHAWILGSVLKAKGFQDCIFRDLVNRDVPATPDLLSSVWWATSNTNKWSATSNTRKSGLPALMMDMHVANLLVTGDYYLRSYYCNEPFMAYVIASLVKRLIAAYAWAGRVVKKGSSISTLDIKNLEEIIAPEVDTLAYYPNQEK